METPEKIYLQDSMSTDTIGELWPEWFDDKVSDNSIEYTRTDSFFDKAAIWFNNNLGHDECGVIAYQFDTEEEMFKDFIEYMKGE